MLAVYRNSLLMRTPTPLRERLGRLAPVGARRGQALAGASPGTLQAGGLPLQSQYDLSDSFIASGGRCGFVTDSACPLTPHLCRHNTYRQGFCALDSSAFFCAQSLRWPFS